MNNQRHRLYLFRNGQLVRVWDEANRILGIGASWWRWSDEKQWRPIAGSPGERETPPAVAA